MSIVFIIQYFKLDQVQIASPLQHTWFADAHDLVVRAHNAGVGELLVSLRTGASPAAPKVRIAVEALCADVAVGAGGVLLAVLQINVAVSHRLRYPTSLRRL